MPSLGDSLAVVLGVACCWWILRHRNDWVPVDRYEPGGRIFLPRGRDDDER